MQRSCNYDEFMKILSFGVDVENRRIFWSPCKYSAHLRDGHRLCCLYVDVECQFQPLK